MEAYAVVQTGGKQYRVKADDVLTVDRLKAEKGETVELQPVLAISDGENLQLGKPAVEGAKVTTEVVDHIRGEKVVNFRKRRRKGYSRKVGHRQELTVLRVASIG